MKKMTSLILIFICVCMVGVPKSADGQQYRSGATGEIESVLRGQDLIIVRHVTNRRRNIFERLNFYIDDNTVIIKNGRQGDINDLYTGDIVEVKTRYNRNYQQATASVTVIKSW